MRESTSHSQSFPPRRWLFVSILVAVCQFHVSTTSSAADSGSPAATPTTSSSTTTPAANAAPATAAIQSTTATPKAIPAPNPQTNPTPSIFDIEVPDSAAKAPSPVRNPAPANLANALPLPPQNSVPSVAQPPNGALSAGQHAAAAAAKGPPTVTVEYKPERQNATGRVMISSGTLKGKPTVNVKCTLADAALHPPALAVKLVYKHAPIEGTIEVAPPTAPVLLTNGVYPLDLTKFATDLVTDINRLLPDGFAPITPLALENNGEVEVRLIPVMSINPLALPPNNQPKVGAETPTLTKLIVRLSAK